MRKLLALAALAAMMTFTTASALAVDDATLQKAMEAFDTAIATRAEKEQITLEIWLEELDKALVDVPFDELTPVQISTLSENGMLMGEARAEAARGRLSQLVGEPTAEGALAAAVWTAVEFSDGPNEGDVTAGIGEAIRTTLAHDGFGEFALTPEAAQFYSVIGQSASNYTGWDAAIGELASTLLDLETILPEGAPWRNVTAAAGLWDLVRGLEVGADEKEAFRAGLVARILGSIELAEADPNAPDNVAERLQASADRLDGAAARGELIGFEAPGIDLMWSTDPDVKSLEDLKGKVVILDFWATWCGPCVGSIPNVKKLVAHYEGYDVVVLAVTSPQGAIYHESGMVETPTPEAEIEELAKYAKDMDLTYIVAMSEQDVFNPDYGVRGIPFVAILDPSGVVRYAGLHPADPFEEKTAKIDALLKEFGLKVPGN